MSIRMRHTKGHSGNRRSHHALKAMKIVTDKVSGNLRLPHRLDEVAGTYRDKLIVEPKAKKAKEPKAKQKTSEKEHEQAHQHERTEEQQNTGSRGIVGKITGAMRPKARSGAGGGGA